MTSGGPEHKAADGTAVGAGQSWAYRARQNDALAQVTVVRLSTQRRRGCWSSSPTRRSRAGSARVGATRPPESPVGIR